MQHSSSAQMLNYIRQLSASTTQKNNEHADINFDIRKHYRNLKENHPFYRELHYDS